MSKKTELQEKNKQLIEHIAKLIKDLQSDAERHEDSIKILEGCRNKLSGDISRAIAGAPEGDSEALSRIQKQWSSYEREYLRLQKGFSAQSPQSQTFIEQRITKKQILYARMMAELAPVTLVPSTDPEIEKIHAKIKMQQARFAPLVNGLNEQMRHHAKDKEERAYDEAINALEAYRDQLNGFKEEIRKREHAANDYQKAQLDKNESVRQVKELLSSTKLAALEHIAKTLLSTR